MDPRFSLRFESGERRGEEIPIPAQGITVGRRPGNSLQILDNSVSGKHAEMLVDGQGVLLRDLGSTNGTRIGPQRIIEHRLAHGDRVFFGNVELAFQDARVADARAADSRMAGDVAGAPVVAPPVLAPGDGMQRTSAELVLRSHKRSRVGLVVIAVLALGTAGLYWWLQRSGLSSTANARPVEAVPGNLLADSYSFEGEADTWSPLEVAPAVFLRTPIDRVAGGASAPSGSVWMSAELAPSEWACHRSPSVAASAGRALQARAKLLSGESVAMQLGLEFASASENGPHPVIAWGEDEVTCAVPAGYDSVRVLVAVSAAKDGGSAGFDDVSLVEAAGGGAPVTKLGEFELALLGDPPRSAVLSKSGRVLVSGLEFPASAAELTSGSPIERREDGQWTRLVAKDGRALRLVAEAPLARARIATIGAAEGGSGFSAHSLDFERADVTDLVLGSGRELLRLKFEKPVRVRGVADGAASRIAIEGEISEVALQHDFSTERTEAGNLAHAARNAEKKSELGTALKVWADLLNGYPYEDALVNEAEATRSRLIQQGLEELRGLRVEVERARFFRLVDLHRQCRDKARAIGARYSPSEVEPEAAALAAEVEKELVGLEADLTRTERARLSAIHKSLLAQKAEGLAAEVASYLAEKQ
jgi:hypothetical protein